MVQGYFDNGDFSMGNQFDISAAPGQLDLGAFLAPEAIYVHGKRKINQMIQIDNTVEKDALRDAKVIEAWLSTALPDDTFNFLFLYISQTMEVRVKVREMQKQREQEKQTVQFKIDHYMGEREDGSANTEGSEPGERKDDDTGTKPERKRRKKKDPEEDN